jgi:hypothetical protein
VQVTVSPNPVPFSGQAITDIASCATRPNTWFYDQVLRETGGVAVTGDTSRRHVRWGCRLSDKSEFSDCGERLDLDPHAVVQRFLVRAHGAVHLQRHRRERENVERHGPVGSTPS